MVDNVPHFDGWQETAQRYLQDSQYVLRTCSGRELRDVLVPEVDFPVTVLRQVPPGHLPCGHWSYFWHFEGSLHLSDNGDELVVAFSDSQELFGISAMQAAERPEAERAVQAKLDGLFKSNARHHVVSVQRQGSGSGGGDVEGAWILAGTIVEVMAASELAS
ncbi:unnamed protein product [Effrenium voratum]|nr:unnamed protein product [Effrenium voratum]